MDKILHLYPPPAAEVPLIGAYLAHHLRQNAEETGRPYIYANFVVSIDGRIAIQAQEGMGMMVPRATANERDWRLYQELAAQADIILSSGRYLREWAAGRAQEILQVNDPRFVDLRQWREENGLAPLPDIAILSNSLNFPIPPVLTAGGRKVVIVTAGKPDPEVVKKIESHEARVVVAGEKSIRGELLSRILAEMGYRTIYSAAGPRILHLLAAGGVMDRLYLTYANRLLGGQPFSSIIEGPLLKIPIDMKIQQIYFDTAALNGLGQLFVSYDRV